MAFRPRGQLSGESSAIPSPTVPTLAPAAPPAALSWPPSALTPTAEPQGDSRPRTAAWMHGLRVLGPVLRRVWASEGTPEQQAALFQQHMAQAGAVAQAWAQALGGSPSDQQAALPLLQAAVLQTEVPLDAWNDRVAPWPALIDQAVGTLAPTSLAVASDHSLRLAVLRALARIVGAQMRFDFARTATRDQDIDMVLGWLLEQAAHHLGRWAEASLPASERQSVFEVVLDEASQLFEQAWEANALRAQDALRGKTTAQIETWRRANPGGFPLDPVFQTAQDGLDRLMRLTQVVQPKRRKTGS